MPVHKCLAHDALVALSGVEDGFGVSDVASQGLFAKDVLAAFYGLDGPFAVKVVG